MKPAHIKEQRLKEVRSINKKQQRLSEEMRNLGYTKLDRPIRHGWYKELVIKRQVERYKNRDAILEVYNKLSKEVWGKTKENAQRKWDAQTSDYLIVRDIPTLSKRQYNKLSAAAKCICIPFQFYTKRKKLKTRFYVKMPQASYRIKFTRAYITHRKRIDPLLEQEYAELNARLSHGVYYETERKLYPWKSYWDWPKGHENNNKIKQQLKALKNNTVSEILAEDPVIQKGLLYRID